MIDPRQPEQPQIPQVQEVGTVPIIAIAIGGGVLFIVLAIAGFIFFFATISKPSPPTAAAPPALIATPVPKSPLEAPYKEAPGDPPAPEVLAAPTPTASSGGDKASGKTPMEARFTGKANVRAGALTVSGRLPVEDVRRVVRERHGRFRMCYEQALAGDSTLRGRLSLRFVIGRDGSVSNVSVSDSNLGEKLDKCVAAATFSMKFSPPEGGIVTVVYPVMFDATPG